MAIKANPKERALPEVPGTQILEPRPAPVARGALESLGFPPAAVTDILDSLPRISIRAYGVIKHQPVTLELPIPDSDQRLWVRYSSATSQWEMSLVD